MWSMTLLTPGVSLGVVRSVASAAACAGETALGDLVSPSSFGAMGVTSNRGCVFPSTPHISGCSYALPPVVDLAGLTNDADYWLRERQRWRAHLLRGGPWQRHACPPRASHFYPCGSVLAHYSAALALHGALADAGAWYMFDWRGSGKSTRPPGSITFAGLVDDLEAVAKAIGEPFDLIAVNDGCGMALAFAARRPEMVRRMLLVSPMGEKTRSGEHYEMWIRTFATDPVMTLTYYLMWVHPGTDNAETFRIAKEAMAAKPLELVDELLHAANGVDLLDYAPHVNTPTFVLYTEGDEEDALELTARMPFARATNWTLIGDGTINGAAWRRAWDEIIPPRESGQSPAASSDPALAAH